jgi:transposase
MRPIVSDQYEFVIGAGTHAATHTFALVASGTGAVLEHAVFPARRPACPGHRDGLPGEPAIKARWRLRGHRLVRRDLDRAPAGSWPHRRRSSACRQASGAAQARARSSMLPGCPRAVPGLPLAAPRAPRALSADRTRVAIVVLIVAREQMASERTRTVNALIALVRMVGLGISARTPLTAAQITTIAGWRDREEDATTATCRHEAVRLARRIRTLDSDLAGNRAYIAKLTGQDTPQLLNLTGVGAVVAASVLIAWSHPGRVRSEAALALLAGICPIPASSGNTIRHRLNRGGDRRLNRAITTITIVRMRVDPATRAYIARRRAEGRTTNEIMRSLKRNITRQLFRVLAAAHPIPTA